MTKRQTQIFDMICQGLTSAEIAVTLKIKIKTVESTRYNMLKDSGCKSMAQLIHSVMVGKVNELNNRTALRISEIF